MALKQKIQDLSLLLQKNRKVQVIAGCCVLGVLFLMFSDNSRPQRRGPGVQPVQTARGVGELSSSESFDDLRLTIGKKQEEQEEILLRIKQDLEDSEKARKESEQRTAQIFKKLITEISANQGAGPAAPSAPGALPDPIDIQPAMAIEESDTLVPFDEDAELEIAPPPAPIDPRIAIISPADSVRVKLLAGVNAPTDGTPYPTIFKLVSDVNGPDGSALPLGEARIIAAAQGSLVDQRVLYRLTKLSLRLPDGSREEISIDGWIVGEDGIRGMQGHLIDPLGKAILGNAYAGFIQGLGTGIAQANTQRVTTIDGGVSEFVTGNTAEFALGQGLQQAGTQYAGIINERLRDLKPLVQVFSGREATAVFSQSAEIPFLYEALGGDEFDVFPASLD